MAMNEGNMLDETLSTERHISVQEGQTVVPPEGSIYRRPLGGPEFLRLHPGAAYTFLVVMGPAAIIGTIGNIMVLGAIVLYRPLRNARNAFLVNLAIGDLCVTTLMDPFSILGEFKSHIALE